MGHYSSFVNGESWLNVRCFSWDGRANDYFDRNTQPCLRLNGKDQIFIYNAYVFTSLTAKEVALMFNKWTTRPRINLQPFQAASIVRYIHYQQDISPSSSSEGKYWAHVTERSQSDLDVIQRIGPPMEIYEKIPDQVVFDNTDEGQSLSTGIASQSVPQSSTARPLQTAAPKGNPKVVRTPESGRSRSPESPSASNLAKNYRLRDDRTHPPAVAASGTSAYISHESSEGKPQYDTYGKEIIGQGKSERREQEKRREMKAIEAEFAQMEKDSTEKISEMLPQEPGLRRIEENKAIMDEELKKKDASTAEDNTKKRPKEKSKTSPQDKQGGSGQKPRRKRD